jgi:hypothetical protein
MDRLCAVGCSGSVLADLAALLGGGALLHVVEGRSRSSTTIAVSPSSRSAATQTVTAAAAAAAYAFNPISLLAVGGGRGELLSNAVLLAAATAAQGGLPATTAALLAAFSYAYPVQGAIAAVPLMLLAAVERRSAGGDRRSVLTDLGAAGAAVATCALFASAGGGDCWRPHLGLHSIDTSASTAYWPPELGLSWYLFSSAFLRFLPYFTMVVWAQPFMYIAPVLLRFW